MAGTYKLYAKRFFIFLNSLVAFVFLLVCLIPYVNATDWWAISLLGLGFPVFFLLLVLFIFFWAIVNPRYILLSLLTLAIGYKSIAVFFCR